MPRGDDESIAKIARDVAELGERFDSLRNETEESLAQRLERHDADLRDRVEAVVAEARESVAAPLVKEVAELRERVVATGAAGQARQTEVEKQTARTLADVNRKVTGLGSRMTTDSALVKALRKSLTEQTRRSDELEKRLNKLEKKG